MNNKIHDAFSQIKAEDQLKRETSSFLSQEMYERSQKRPRNFRRSLATALAVFMVFFGIGGYSAWATPISYISVDVNPSVELSLNRFDRVIDVTEYSEDGRSVLEGISLRGKTYTNAIDTLVDSDALKQYLSEDSLLAFTVVSDKKEELLDGIRQCNSYRQYGGTSGSVDSSVMHEAHKNRVSFGKYTVYLLLAEYDTTKTFEDYRGFTMRQLDDMLKSYGGDSQIDIQGPGGGFGPGHGSQEGPKGI